MLPQKPPTLTADPKITNQLCVSCYPHRLYRAWGDGKTPRIAAIGQPAVSLWPMVEGAESAPLAGTLGCQCRLPVPVFSQTKEASSTEAAVMKSTWVFSLLAIAALAVPASRVEAAYCGLASYEHGQGVMTTVSFSAARASLKPVAGGCPNSFLSIAIT